MNYRLAVVYLSKQQLRSRFRAALGPSACLALSLAVGACSAPSERAAAEDALASAEQALVSDIDPTKSLVITDVDIVSKFTLQEVLDKLSNNQALALFHQMFATQLRSGDPNSGAGPYCNGSINGFPAECPRADAIEETASNPFADLQSDAAYMATTLSNRFDLAPADGANCGEYRINFARRSGLSQGFGRLFIAFEARLPNPSPGLGLAGCRPVVEFWNNLSALSSEARTSELRRFYFQGLPGFAPVIDVHQFGETNGPQGGQIRINELLFLNQLAGDWSMREFRLMPSSGGPLPYLMQPNFDKDVPERSLFNPNPSPSNKLTADFQANFFPSTVERLALQDLNAMNYSEPVPDRFNSGDSHMLGGSLTIPSLFSNYAEEFGFGASNLRSKIQAKLSAIGSPLTPDNIVARATSLSCGGCHNISQDEKVHSLGLPQAFPPTGGFVQVLEETDPINGDESHRRFRRTAFIEAVQPYRAQIMRDFLTPVPGFERANAWTSGQSTVSLSTTTKTEGSSSLRVVPSAGWTEITSIPTSLVGAGKIGPSLKVDLYLPTNQPNPYYYGAVSVFVSSPSARVYNQYLGQVNLNGLPTGKFSSLAFALPATLQQNLGYGLTDVTFKIQLNVNSNSSAYYFDNLRFR